MPLAYGGGIQSIEDINNVMNTGVEKVVINSAAIENSRLIQNAANQYGSQSIVVSIDVKKKGDGSYEVMTKGGLKATDLDPVFHARHMESLGAGEIFLNSIDRDGIMRGYDIPLIKSISSKLSIPLIACGGAGELNHFSNAISLGGADAVAAGSFFVYHGRHRAVLITYPMRKELEDLFSLKKTKSKTGFTDDITI